jgi:hypothetical protein
MCVSKLLVFIFMVIRDPDWRWRPSLIPIVAVKKIIGQTYGLSKRRLELDECCKFQLRTVADKIFGKRVDGGFPQPQATPRPGDPFGRDGFDCGTQGHDSLDQSRGSGEGSTLNDVEEITAIAFAFANRARAWGGKTVDEVIAADPSYTYAIDGTNQRYESFMKTSSVAEINRDSGMAIALQGASKAWANEGVDPSNGKHPKVKDGFRFSDPSHNIFGVPEKSVDVSVFWKVRDVKTGAEIDSKLRGKYRSVWISTAARATQVPRAFFILSAIPC